MAHFVPMSLLSCGLSLARHVQFCIHDRMVLSRGALFLVLALASVKYLVWVHDLSRFVSWWIALLCHAMRSPLRKLFPHRENRCGHVPMLFPWHSV